jgi:hypothetical protein
MSYTDFTLESAESAFGLTARPGILFPDFEPLPVPDWLVSFLELGQSSAALVSEKVRSESLVFPVLLAARQMSPDVLSIYSGQRLDVDASLGLVGECDFILARTPPVARLKAPLVTILEAKKNDIESGLGQCVAQMVAARLFNERAGESIRPLFGCVTTGEVWQFLRLDGDDVTIDRDRLFINDVGDILAILRLILAQGGRAG